MTLIEWKEALSVQIDAVDADHQKLIAIMNRYFELMRRGEAKSSLAKTINDLLRYAGYHFRLEEDYFKQYEYPEAGEHRKQHAYFLKKVLEFRIMIEDNVKMIGDLAVTVALWQFMSEWLMQHIRVEDRKYSDYFAQSGDLEHIQQASPVS